MLGFLFNELLVQIRFTSLVSIDELIIGYYVLAKLMNLMVMFPKEFEGLEVGDLPLFKLITKSVYPFADFFLKRFWG